MSDDSVSPTHTLEPIAYLARSEHRIRVFQTLTETITKPGLDNPGYDPRDLREETGASEATISRMLNEFQDRGWIERNTNGEYVSTPLGHSIAVAFNPLVESMAAIQHFGEGPGTMWRAPNELSIDVGRRDGLG